MFSSSVLPQKLSRSSNEGLACLRDSLCGGQAIGREKHRMKSLGWSGSIQYL